MRLSRDLDLETKYDKTKTAPASINKTAGIWNCPLTVLRTTPKPTSNEYATWPTKFPTAAIFSPKITICPISALASGPRANSTKSNHAAQTKTAL